MHILPMDAQERNFSRKKRLKGMKLRLGEKVEVLSCDEEFTDSWHEAKVVCSEMDSCTVEYFNMLNDDHSKIVETIPMWDAIEVSSMTTGNNNCGRIRPVPPQCVTKPLEIRYGLCIDALFHEAWWEGVILDHEEGSKERLVFFPGLGDQQSFSVDHIRITQDWNEDSGNWKPRGHWLLLQVLELFEQEDSLPVSIREIWYDLRATDAFTEKITAWTSGTRPIWYSLVSDLIHKLRSTVNGLLVSTETHKQTPDISSTPDDSEDMCKEFLCLEGYDLLNDDGVAPSDLPVTVNGFRSGGHPMIDCDATSTQGILASKLQKPWKRFELEAAYCSEVISLLDTGTPQGERMRLEGLNKTRVRGHLLALGWRIERKIDTIKRLRYISPEGKTFYSLKKVWCYLKGMYCPTQPEVLHEYLKLEEASPVQRKENFVPEEACPTTQKELVLEKDSMNECLKPTLLPNVIREYADYMESVKRKEEHKCLNIDVKRLRANAKNLLLSMGWKFWIINKKTREELRYTSPSGRTYISLLTACMAYLEPDYNGKTHKKCTVTTKSRKKCVLADAKSEDSVEKNMHNRLYKSMHCWEYITSQEAAQALDVVANLGDTSSIVSESREAGVGRLCLGVVKKTNKRIKISAVHDQLQRHPSSGSFNHQRSKKQKTSEGPVCLNDGSRFPKHQLRPSKISQLSVHSPSPGKAKTVLNWLIDNNLILPREKVFYSHNRNRRAMKEGRITPMGIKCNCCERVFSLASFEAHAGSSTRRPAANIYLQPGKSLLQCQVQMLRANKLRDFPHVRQKSDCSHYLTDDICSVCHDGGSLMLCDHCPSVFHPECIGLKDAPEGDWFCPSCRCAICGSSEYNFDTKQFDEKTVLYCDQCESGYHVGCLEKRGSLLIKSCPTGSWMCSTKCLQIFRRLRGLVGKSNPAVVKGLSWTLLRSRRENGVDLDESDIETMSECHCKLSIAVDMLHECFVTMVEPRTRSDFVADLLFNQESELKRLNFWGFYTMLLEKGDELVSVATFRIYGEKVAEMPFIGTSVHHRRQGMCRLLMNELEKLLSSLGVERLILPAVPQLLRTWTKSFGFTRMTSSDRLELSQYTFLNFQGTIMCQKDLRIATELPLQLQNL